jgi:hypothetical protein
MVVFRLGERELRERKNWGGRAIGHVCACELFYPLLYDAA